MTAPTVGSLICQSRYADGREVVDCLHADPVVHLSNSIETADPAIVRYEAPMQVGTLVHFHFSNRHVVYRITGRAEYSDGVWVATWPD